MAEDFDLENLLHALFVAGVDFVVIGGVAAQAHGHRRSTLDLDVIPSPALENLDVLAAVLCGLDARPRDTPGGSSPTAEQLRVAAIVPPLVTPHGSLHILNTVPGAPPYPRLRERAIEVDFDGISLSIASLDDLIAMKRASGRPQDLEDIAALIAANPPT